MYNECFALLSTYSMKILSYLNQYLFFFEYQYDICMYM